MSHPTSNLVLKNDESPFHALSLLSVIYLSLPMRNLRMPPQMLSPDNPYVPRHTSLFTKWKGPLSHHSVESWKCDWACALLCDRVCGREFSAVDGDVIVWYRHSIIELGLLCRCSRRGCWLCV
jgi:hypothetical protein